MAGGRKIGAVGQFTPEHPSNFKTPAGEAEYIAAYDATLTLWATPHEFLQLPTPWGPTHVIRCGPEDGLPVVLLHGMHLSATMWYANAAALSRRYRVYAIDTIGGVGRSVAVRPLKSRADLAGWLSAILDGLGLTRTHLLAVCRRERISDNLKEC